MHCRLHLCVRNGWCSTITSFLKIVFNPNKRSRSKEKPIQFSWAYALKSDDGSKTEQANILSLCCKKRWWQKNQIKALRFIQKSYVRKALEPDSILTELVNPCSKKCYFHRLWKTYSCGSFSFSGSPLQCLPVARFKLTSKIYDEVRLCKIL